MRILKYILAFVAIINAITYISKNQSPYMVLRGKTMGTYYHIKVKAKGDVDKLTAEIDEELAKINSSMSVFDKKSEISMINQAPKDEWVELSAEMQTVLKEAYNIYKLSNGSFDPTVGNLINLWGFGPNNTVKNPSKNEIMETLENSGFDKIIFSEDFKRLKKTNDKVSINLSAIAKGYGVDRISNFLKSKSYKDFVVEIGGEVYATGSKNDRTNGWNIGIAKPNKDNNDSNVIITIKDIAVATSGDYRNIRYVGNKIISHTISPVTGYPIESQITSVTIFDNNCMQADALATAIMAMEEKDITNFIDKNEIAAIILYRDENNLIKTNISEKAKKIIGK